MKRIKLCTIGLLVLFSCSSSEDFQEIHPNIGAYKLVSLESDVALDLNYDNIASKNFMKELEIYLLGRRKQRHELELAPILETTDADFRLGLPRDGYHPDQMFIELRLGVGDYSKRLLFNDSNKPKIEHKYFVTNQLLDSTYIVNETRNPYPYDVTLNSDDKVTLKVIQKFYDIKKEEWVTVRLIGVFEKKE